MISSAQLFDISASPKLIFLNQNRTIILELFLSVACGLISPVCSDIVPWCLFLASWRIHGIYGNILALLLESVNSLKSLPSAPSTTARALWRAYHPQTSLLWAKLRHQQDLEEPSAFSYHYQEQVWPTITWSLFPTSAHPHWPGKSTFELLVVPSLHPIYLWESLCPKSPIRRDSRLLADPMALEYLTLCCHSHSRMTGFLLLQQNLSHSHQQMCLLLGAKGRCLKGKEILEGTIW